MKMQTYPDREMMAIDLANIIAGKLENGLFNHETVSLAVPGGTTPGPIFDTLCAVELDWSRVHVIASDERWVPEDHPRSNARLIRERLLVEKAAAARFVGFYRNGMTPESAAPELVESLKPALPLSVLLLGMGVDRHVASLFPGSAGLVGALAPEAPAVVAMRPDNQPEARISLSAPTLNSALSKHLIITGENKRKALESALSLPPEDAPVQAVLGGMTVHWAE